MGAKTKLVLAALLVTAVIGYLAYLGASSSWQYYLLVDECVGQADQLRGKRLRVSGRVAVDSLHITDDRRGATFLLEGNQYRLPVSYEGALPDNLAEGRDVVVEGGLQPDGQLEGETILTRCASKYAPKDASRSEEEGREATGPQT
jgi:cytochrome c-type biogenesis protein CcmE